jgi:L-amino acid N-acyltransferase YncA
MFRVAVPNDAPAILAIYAPVVRDTAISFELEPPSVIEIRRRISSTLERFPWIAGRTEDRSITGYVYARLFRERPAYQWTAETTIYAAPSAAYYSPYSRQRRVT